MTVRETARRIAIARGDEPADLALFDPDEQWIVDAGGFRSKSKNSAFTGLTLYGRVKQTILEGVNVTASLPGA